MRSSILIAALLAAGILNPSWSAQPDESAEEFKIDGVHSSLVFRVKHLGVSYFYGRFNDIAGSFTYDKNSPGQCAFEVTSDADSVDTGARDRDRHLKSPDFFNAKQFPSITFKSSGVKKTGDDIYEVTGELTLHGVSKQITVPLTHTGSGPGLRGGFIRGFEGSFKIKRSDFEMNYMLDKLGDEVTITASLEGVRQR